ncbi:carbohydrate binding domain-containing protein [Curtobacterium flaccumfaciens]|uniref:carbohydrate binding domain-containing protein n=1 Tax=Curtobacterium flaccumfaciens TaxID=2035 RepID=UPI001BDEBEE0|nr:carbohydrate binding domain-containing protein [Curtobacterium flaccumfaciens]MBT1633760.1 carbohydrate binding domain-containing protein [Curtobacterium flaccumfaciens pv. oortii]MCX2845564.1 carbohydrate binding domain-containing protein [Curtobacterium flaccumfaciens pv. oortii]
MSTRRIDTTAQIILEDGTGADFLDIIACTYTQDEGAAPYLTAALTIAPPSLAVYAKLDPAATPATYIQIHATLTPDVGEWSDWTFIVGIEERTRATDGSVTLALAGPERDLIAYSPSDPRTANILRSAQSDVWSILQGVFVAAYGSDRIPAWADYSGRGMEGVIPAEPTPFSVYQAATNLIANGGFEGGSTAGWTASACTMAANTAWAATGQYALRLYPNTSSTNSYAYTDVTVQPNTTYTVSATIRVGAPMTGSTDAAARRILVTGAVGGQGYELGRSSQGPSSTNGTQRLTRTFKTPAMLDNNSIRIRLYHGQTSTGFSAILWDDVLLVEGDGLDTDGFTPIPFFDGGTLDGTGGYNYDWQNGLANASPSTRTPVIARDPDTLTWRPGTSAWDFVQPILQALGLRLFATGYVRIAGAGVLAMWSLVTNQYAWRDIPPAYFTLGRSLYDIEPTVSRTATFPDGTPMFADQVVLHYTWTDELNQPREEYDVYPTAPAGRTPYYLELADTPYPGPGRAEGLYRRLSARAQQLSIVGPFDPWVIPATQVVVSAEGILAADVIAYADQTTHDPIAGTVAVRTKQAIDFPDAAWMRLPAGQSWNASPTGASWTAETIN